MISPRRRTTRKEYLDASVVPVEAALVTRAEALDAQAEAPDTEVIKGQIQRRIAAEFRALAEELHWW